MSTEFERLLHRRTVAYLPGFRDDGRAVVVMIPEAAHTPAGHAMAHALVNLLARAHRRLAVVGDLDVPLLCPSPLAAATLRDATTGLATAINPYIEIVEQPTERLISLGVGAAGADLDLGADGWIATAGPGAALADRPESVIGASLAACLGSYAAFGALTGTGRLEPGCWSAWEHAAPGGAQGPTFIGPIDVGDVLCAGGGAVASALLFFAAFFGIGGVWTIVDGDIVDVTNLNRQLAFIATDAGWPDRQPVNKAGRLAALLGPVATPVPHWYDEVPALDRTPFDVVLPLANDRGVRAQLAHRQPTVMLHATTSPNWQAQTHRHIAGHDDCITCRLPSTEPPPMRCSEGHVPKIRGKRMDAALPFLSATAGVMLAADLIRLQTGSILERPYNFAAVEFTGNGLKRQQKIFRCRSGCRTRLPAHIRRQLDARSRWAALDAA
jgi:hypothetical protein